MGPGHQGGGPVRGLTAPGATVAAAGVPRLRVVDSITELVPGAEEIGWLAQRGLLEPMLQRYLTRKPAASAGPADSGGAALPPSWSA